MQTTPSDKMSPFVKASPHLFSASLGTAVAWAVIVFACHLVYHHSPPGWGLPMLFAAFVVGDIIGRLSRLKNKQFKDAALLAGIMAALTLVLVLTHYARHGYGWIIIGIAAFSTVRWSVEAFRLYLKQRR